MKRKIAVLCFFVLIGVLVYVYRLNLLDWVGLWSAVGDTDDHGRNFICAIPRYSLPHYWRNSRSYI